MTVAKKAAPATPKKPTTAGKANPGAKASGSGTTKAATKATTTSAKPPVKKVVAGAASAAAKKPAPLKEAGPVAAPAPAKSAAPAPFKKSAPPPVPKRPTVGPYAKEPKFLEEQRVLLLEERGVYDGQAHDLRAEADSLALEREPGDVQFDEESGEGGTVTVDRERNLALSAQASAAVEEIDDALRKVERTTYGACERCHQPIPKARLRALPFARLCVACKSGGLSRR